MPLLGHAGGAVDVPEVAEHGELVALVEPDTERVAAFRAFLGGSVAESFAAYTPEEFDAMVADVAPDAVLVAAPDHTHADYIVAALGHGLDVITEKPMVTTAAAAVRVLDAERRSTGTVRVAHNLRYAPRHRQLKAMVAAGKIGRPVSVELVWNVETLHGASYFRRWNRTRRASGGLSVHKSCHHLDLASWLIGGVPTSVFAFGARNFYGPDSPHRPRRADGSPYPKDEEVARDPYRARWAAGGRLPDGLAGTTDVRRGSLDLAYVQQYPAGQSLHIYDDEIDIEDTYSAVVGYQGGASMTYAVNFAAPWEGYRLALNGTHGRIETSLLFDGHGSPPPEPAGITWYPMFDQPQVLAVAGTEEGGHLGADAMMVRELFTGPSAASTQLGSPASAWEGALAVATGEAIWRSATDGHSYDIHELLTRRA